MADEAEVIISAIEKLDSWLQLKKADLCNDNHQKLSSLMLGKTTDLCSLVVGMAELWEDNREKLYSLLVRVADPPKATNEEAETSGKIKEKACSLLVEMTGLWEDDDNKEKLHSLLLEMADHTVVFEEKYFSLLVEMMDLWEVSKGNVSKEKVNSWLVNKADHLICNHNKEKLHSVLNDIMFSRRGEEEMKLIHRKISKKVEEAKNELRVILGVLDGVKKMEGLHYFISDVVEMADDARLLIGVMDSDPFILFLQIFNCFIKMRNPLAVHPLLKFLEKIVYIQKGLQETRKRMYIQELALGSTPTSTATPTSSDHVVGLEEDVELLLSMKNDHAIIFIKGMSGIGKTTLARQLYNHPAVVDQYERRAWICLSSRELSRKQLLIKLIQQLLHTSKGFERDDDMMLMEKSDNKSLRQTLHNQLMGNRYFIVLDHVSSDVYFEYFAKALPRGHGCRLLLTTSRPDLTCDVSFEWPYDHKMKSLDDDKSWQLLLKTAICYKEFPKQLVRKGREILMRKCGGLPLAIKEVGRQWAEKRWSGSEWEQVVVDSSMDLDLSTTLAALESTYLNLDQHAKSCFLRLALFKEGIIIRANKLLQIWNAGGVNGAQCKSVLYKLTEESIMEVEYQLKSYKVKTCRINVVFHRLSITKVEDENNNPASHEPRHRVFHCSRDKFDYNYSSTNQDEHLVSIFFHGGGGHSDICCPSYWNNFKQLKILDMEGFGLKILPEMVGELSELRYLGLRNNYIQELPHSLGHLKKLKVLDIAQNFMVGVADVIWKMDSLRHLYISDINCWKPLKIDSLRNLQTLTYISIDSWIYDVSCLKMMTRLRRVGIEDVDGNADVSKVLSSLAKLKNINCLILRGFRFRSMPSVDELGLLQNLTELKLEGCLTRLPSANNFPPKLLNLILVNSCLDEDPMPILEKLPVLQYLKLQNAYTGQQMVISHKGFIALDYLLIGELWHLKNLQVGKGALRNLSQLEVNSCPYLDILPEEICSLISGQLALKMVTSKHIATKIRKLGFISRSNKVDIQP